MMDEILAAMPLVEREILENETKKFTAAPPFDPRSVLLSSSRSLATSSPLSPMRSNATNHLHNTSNLHTPSSLHPPHTPPINSVQPSTFASSGSANVVPNAFFEPASMNGVKRALGHDSPRPVPTPPSVPAPGSPERDVDMESESPAPSPEDEQAPTPLEYSVFEKRTQLRPPKPTQSRTRLPPGAFVESEEEPSPENTDDGRQRSQTTSPPPSPPPVEKLSRKTRQIRPKEPEMSRSIPGSLTGDDNENEQDRLAPLPASRSTKRAPRKGRVSRQPSQESEETSTQPRRSSRLAATSSSDSKASEPSRTRAREKK
jgi:hypothetical protein